MLALLLLLVLCNVRGGRIDVPNAAAIKNTSYIAYQLYSYQVGIVAENGLEALSMFDSVDRSRIARHVKRKSKDKTCHTNLFLVHCGLILKVVLGSPDLLDRIETR